MENDKSNILKFLRKRDFDSGSKCGTSVACLVCEFKIDYNNLRLILNELFHEKKIKLRLGINGKLLFPTNTKK